MENAGEFHGLYYVLGGALSTIDGIGPHDTHLGKLTHHISLYPKLSEIIIATSMTANGQTTAHYIAHLLKEFPHISLSRIAPGVPMGGELDYLDSGTLNAALASRTPFSLTSVK
jgi:recombination protein RecR